MSEAINIKFNPEVVKSLSDYAQIEPPKFTYASSKLLVAGFHSIGGKCPPHINSFPILEIINHASCYHERLLKESCPPLKQKLKGGEISLYLPNSIYELTWEGAMEYMLIVPEPSILGEIIEEIPNGESPIFDEFSNDKMLTSLVEQIKQIASDTDYRKYCLPSRIDVLEQHFICHLADVYLKFKTRINTTTGGLSPKILKNVLDFINEQIREDKYINTEELAGIAKLPLYNFIKSFEISMRKPPYVYCNDKRLEKFIREDENYENIVQNSLKSILNFVHTEVESGRALKVNDMMSKLCRPMSSVNDFNKQFKKLMGIPPKEYVNNLRIERAVYLLLTTNLLIEQVASKCGYNKHDSFADYFEKHFQMSPRAFREKFGNSRKWFI